MFGLFGSKKRCPVKETFDGSLREIKRDAPRALQAIIAGCVISELTNNTSCAAEVLRVNLPSLAKDALDRRHAALRDGAKSDADSRYAIPALLESWYMAALVEPSSLEHIHKSILMWAESLGVSAYPAPSRHASPSGGLQSSARTNVGDSLPQAFKEISTEIAFLKHAEKLAVGYHINMANSLFGMQFGTIEGYLSEPSDVQKEYLNRLEAMAQKISAQHEVGGNGYRIFAMWLVALAGEMRDMEAQISKEMAVLSKLAG